VMPQRYVGIVIRAEPRCSYSIRRRDDGAAVTLSRVEGNRTNYRLRVGDQVAFSVYRNGSRLHAFDPWLLGVIVHYRKPVRKLPPYYALGPVIRVGRR
jgi:hypothetical protein